MDGYKIIDFGGVDVTATPTVKGIFNAIDESTKPLIFTNLTATDFISVKPIFVSLCSKVSTGASTYAYVVNSPVIDSGTVVNMFINDDDSITLVE